MLGFGRVRQAFCISLRFSSVSVRTAIALKIEKICKVYRRFGWTSKESGVEIMWEVGGDVTV